MPKKSRPTSEPDYDYWIKMPKWELFDAVALLLEVDPLEHRKYTSMGSKFLDVEEGLKKQFDRLYGLAESNYLDGNIQKRVDFSPEYNVDPGQFIKWALSYDLPVPKKLQSLSKEGMMITMPFSDPEHACYSKELAVAVELWMEFYKEEASPRKYSKEKLMGLIQERFPDIKSKKALERITTLINPDANQKGGAKPTGSQ